MQKLNRSDIRLTIIGSRGFDASFPLTLYERNVREAVAALGERAEIKPFLPREDVAAALSTADVVVVPSRWSEPFPVTILEGMAAGAAVIGSEIGGLPESLRGIGILVPPEDSDALAGAIEALADDERLLRETASACSQYAVEHDWSYASAVLSETLADLE